MLLKSPVLFLVLRSPSQCCRHQCFLVEGVLMILDFCFNWCGILISLDLVFFMLIKNQKKFLTLQSTIQTIFDSLKKYLITWRRIRARVVKHSFCGGSFSCIDVRNNPYVPHSALNVPSFCGFLHMLQNISGILCFEASGKVIAGCFTYCKLIELDKFKKMFLRFTSRRRLIF